MRTLNYQHLLYFWMVTREGGVTRASEKLRLAQPTVSSQVRALEEQLGEKLLRRAGRGVELTEAGRVVFRYADEIFALGRELLDAVHGRPAGRALKLVVGIADVVPKLVAYRLLKPALELAEPVRMTCVEGKPDRLLADLATYAVDLVIADAPVGAASRVRAFNHLLGECGVSFFASPELQRGLARRFPKSLAGAPMFLPAENTVLRTSLERWFDAQAVRPAIAAEFEDSALMKAFGHGGGAVFPGPSVIEKEICAQYDVRVVGRAPAVRERFYAISVERRIQHPAVVAISDSARGKVFA